MSSKKKAFNKSQYNTFEGAISRLDEPSKIAKIDPEAIDQLKHPKYIVDVSIPVRMDNGSLKIFKGFRVKHDDKRGPTKGGVRFHPNLTVHQMKALAFWMTIKCSLLNIPFGGSKGGIIVNTLELSHLELERLSRGYINKIADFIGPKNDVLAPDMNTNSMIMGWMMDEYSIIARQHSPATVTGKPLALGGSEGREDATGHGAFFCIKELEKKFGWKKNKLKVAIQGFGNVGENVAKYLHKDEYKIVAVSDFEGGVYDQKGIDIPELIKKKNELQKKKNIFYQTISNITDYKKISNEELLALDVDILIPAAMENQITAKNAKKIQASYIIELANGPITSEADEILKRNKIKIIPDILVNAGGAVVSYFEWTQNLSGYYWNKTMVHQELKNKMLTALHEVFEAKEKHKIDYRTAAYVCALNRLGKAIIAGGTRSYYSLGSTKIKTKQKQTKK